jgi:hypothetical protein
MQLKHYQTIPIIVLISLATQIAVGENMNWKSIGLRAGMNDNRNDEDFNQYESFATWSLPWIWHPSINSTFGTYIEANAGVLRGGGESAFVGSIGPGIYFAGFNDKLDISIGLNPTIISKHKFGDEDLGGPIQFNSYIGLNFNFAEYFSIGYRLQHMSNGSFYEQNPGVNMHMIEVGYRF